MTIPGYQSLMLPLLQMAADGNEQGVREVIQKLADQWRLTPEDKRGLLPSGRQAIFDNRVGWAIS
ncbi:MAG: winged helix-turn-helix domain-containing protein, partial [Chloroflexota bacterium]